MAKTNKPVRQHAGNNAFLADAKKTYNAKIYSTVLALVNEGAEHEAVLYLMSLVRSELRREWLIKRGYRPESFGYKAVETVVEVVDAVVETPAPITVTPNVAPAADEQTEVLTSPYQTGDKVIIYGETHTVTSCHTRWHEGNVVWYVRTYEGNGEPFGFIESIVKAVPVETAVSEWTPQVGDKVRIRFNASPEDARGLVGTIRKVRELDVFEHPYEVAIPNWYKSWDIFSQEELILVTPAPPDPRRSLAELEALRLALDEIIEKAIEAQGEWAVVMAEYTPEHIGVLKDIVEIAENALSN